MFRKDQLIIGDYVELYSGHKGLFLQTKRGRPRFLFSGGYIGLERYNDNLECLGRRIYDVKYIGRPLKSWRIKESLDDCSLILPISVDPPTLTLEDIRNHCNPVDFHSSCFISLDTISYDYEG